MPTYEYRCEKGHVFEEFQSILADPIQVCPVCGAHAERIISGGTGLIFKGSGFYITDYAHKNSAGGRNPKSLKSYDSEMAADSKASSDSASPAPAAETKTESTPAVKTDEKKSKPEG
ncbi:MAG TPA: zinc ribbon domain-containing protein [bacterium]|jgi:putative FmdB family regulatory protein